MIKIKISDLLGKHKLSMLALSNATGIRCATISTLYHETAKHLDIGMLNKLCEFFDCPLHEVIEYIPDEVKNKKY